MFAILLLCAACGRTERTEARLPAEEVLGAESGGYNLFYKNTREGATAIGQIFSIPKGHPNLIYVGFLYRKYKNINPAPQANLKLIISEWQNDRPVRPTLWESEIKTVMGESIGDWLEFNLPSVKLKPGVKYIAWLTLSDLENADDASLSIVNMGPRTLTPMPTTGEPWNAEWKFAYAEGQRAMWRHGNPDGITDYMTEYPWKTDAPGHNLHFNMLFENRAK
ncbi:hypothetical protein [Methylomonas methanica]|uniref:Uncharacterized protein n=1 Tax=Methylomonas methanica TaxID=421 RepID=A0A177M9G7_METMH|nr:hypothetical protein [Methylomonas methanica]OAH99045.1 hypothetical protein A1332_03915 [Methylomonas methanica]OAI02184.1 hypothetical protein A1353_16860 [Methylomonas methanica]